MPMKKSESSKEDIVRVALNLAEDRGWGTLTLADIAEEAGVTLADMQGFFEDKTDILMALGKMIDHQVLENIGELDDEMSERDRLFDVLMERFDVLNEYRGGILAILRSLCCDPVSAVISLPHLARSMAWMLEAAGIEATGVSGAVRVTGLTGVYLKVLKVWKDDHSPDMVKVMAALDKDLGRAQSFVDLLSL